MTKAQFRKRYRQLVRDEAKWMLRFGEAALNSGAFDLKSETAEWGLVKDVFCAACERTAGPSGHGPIERSSRTRINNIRLLVPTLI